MILVLRPYQQAACEQVEQIWGSGLLRVILCLPTGGGKTECGKWLMRRAKHPVVFAHTRSLVEQAQRRFRCEALTVQAFRARQRKGNPWGLHQPDLVVWDEIHHGDSADWQAAFEAIPEGCPVLGLTATPWRFTHGTVVESRRKNARFGKGLGDLFDSMVVGVRPSELVRDGYLVPLEVVNVVAAEDEAAILRGALGPSYDFDDHKHTGRIKADGATRLCAFSAWQRYGGGRKTIVYSHLVAAAEATLERFLAAGIPAAIVHGKLKPKDCSARLAAFARGELRVLVNCMQLTEGVDVPDVECIILDRGCSSLNTYIQICGRAARPAPGKSGALILDLTGASAEHGHPQKDQDYWVVTAENRNVSEQACKVCGTKVSPMFPTRCMRCDPFRPQVGARVELLDTGARVYSRLKDAGCDLEQQRAAMAATLRLPDLTDAEAARAQAEFCRASALIQHREQQAAAKRDAEERAARVAAERERLRAESERLNAVFQAQQAERQQEQSKAATELKPMLARKIDYALEKGWGIGWAAKVVRDQKWPGQYTGFNMPEGVTAALAAIDAERNGELLRAETERMLRDERTAKFGAAWCRRKAMALFGR